MGGWPLNSTRDSVPTSIKLPAVDSYRVLPPIERDRGRKYRKLRSARYAGQRGRGAGCRVSGVSAAPMHRWLYARDLEYTASVSHGKAVRARLVQPQR